MLLQTVEIFQHFFHRFIVFFWITGVARYAPNVFELLCQRVAPTPVFEQLLNLRTLHRAVRTLVSVTRRTFVI